MTHRLFRLDGTSARHPEVDVWLAGLPAELGALAHRWFKLLRSTGVDVREVMHDGQATACVGDVAFAYVGAFTAHVNVGFFHGSELPDPQRLLEGTGKFMRHVKLRPTTRLDARALEALIASAYVDVRRRIEEA